MLPVYVAQTACQFGIPGCGISVRLKAFTPFGIPALWIRHPGVRHFGPAFGIQHSGLLPLIALTVTLTLYH